MLLSCLFYAHRIFVFSAIDQFPLKPCLYNAYKLQLPPALGTSREYTSGVPDYCVWLRRRPMYCTVRRAQPILLHTYGLPRPTTNKNAIVTHAVYYPTSMTLLSSTFGSMLLERLMAGPPSVQSFMRDRYDRWWSATAVAKSISYAEWVSMAGPPYKSLYLPIDCRKTHQHIRKRHDFKVVTTRCNLRVHLWTQWPSLSCLCECRPLVEHKPRFWLFHHSQTPSLFSSLL